jgi:hypothetical protein
MENGPFYGGIHSSLQAKGKTKIFPEASIGCMHCQERGNLRVGQK